MFSRSRGAFGTARAAFAVTETQSRGSLHLHAMLWSSICPNVLEKLAGHPFLEKAFIEVLNTQFVTALPVRVHVDDLVNRARQRIHNQRENHGESDQGIRRSRCSHWLFAYMHVHQQRACSSTTWARRQHFVNAYAQIPTSHNFPANSSNHRPRHRATLHMGNSRRASSSTCWRTSHPGNCMNIPTLVRRTRRARRVVGWRALLGFHPRMRSSNSFQTTACLVVWAREVCPQWTLFRMPSVLSTAPYRTQNAPTYTYNHVDRYLFTKKPPPMTVRARAPTCMRTSPLRAKLNVP